MLNFKTKDCLNLPENWKNRVSSIATNKCIALYTEDDCKPEQYKLTFINDKVYFDDDLKQQTYQPSYSFYRSWYKFN